MQEYRRIAQKKGRKLSAKEGRIQKVVEYGRIFYDLLGCSFVRQERRAQKGLEYFRMFHVLGVVFVR